MSASLEIRRAAIGDEELVLRLLLELADYERLSDKFVLTAERVRQDFLADTRAAFCELGVAGEEPAGLATWYPTYSSFRGMRGIYLEDLYVRPQFRGLKFGKALIGHLASQARSLGGAYLAWTVLDWNRNSIDFYESLGAGPIEGWTDYRLEGTAFAALGR